MTPAKIRHHILAVLHDCQGYMLPEQSLVDQVRLAMAGAPTGTEIRTEISWLESHGYITGVTAEIDNVRKWRITDKGRTEL